MARKLAVLVWVVLCGLAIWLWRDSAPAALPLAAPQAEHAAPQTAKPEAAPAERREEAPAAAATAPAPASALLVVLCRAKETGAPLPEQNVYLSIPNPGTNTVPHAAGARGKAGESVTTGADGRAEFELPPGVAATLWVHPEKLGANQTTHREIDAFAAGERRELALELTTLDDAHFFARVVARETHAACAGAAVRGHTRPLFTDADGRFDLPFATWNPESLAIDAPGFAESRVQAQSGHETPETALVIELERSSTLVGLLRDAADASKGQTLTLQVETEDYRLQEQDPMRFSGGGFGGGNARWRADFDASGRAEATGVLPNAPLRVAVLAGNKKLVELAERVTLLPGETREVELRISNVCKLTGVAKDDRGVPVPDLTLWLLRAGTSPHLYLSSWEDQDLVARTKTDAQGRFTLPKVSPGSWRLGPEAKMYRDGAPIPADAVAPLAILVEIPTGEHEREVELLVHRGITIRGSVLDPDGKPVDNAGIGARTGTTWLGTSCGSDGTFVLGPLAPGSYTLDASPSYHKEFADSEPVQVEAGARDVVLHLRIAGRLAGRVVDALSGAGLAAQIAVSVPGDKTVPIYMPNSKPDGSFEIGGLLPGCYALAATLPDGRTGLLRGVGLSAGAKLQDLVIQVHPGAKLRVRYAGDQPVASLSIEQDGVRFSGDGVEKGTSKTFSAPAGKVSVICRLRDSGARLVRELILEPGSEQELVFKDQD